MTWLCVECVCVCVYVWRQYRPHVVKLWQAAAAAAFQPSQGMRLNWLWPVQFLCVLVTFIFAIFSQFNRKSMEHIFHGIKQSLATPLVLSGLNGHIVQCIVG